MFNTIHVWYITYIYHKNQPNVGKYTIHGWYGLCWEDELIFSGCLNGFLTNLLTNHESLDGTWASNRSNVMFPWDAPGGECKYFALMFEASYQYENNCVSWSGWWQLKYFFLCGEDEPILTHIFQMGWNHQIVVFDVYRNGSQMLVIHMVYLSTYILA